MTRKEREQLLEKTAETGVEKAIDQGYAWLTQTLLPEMAIAETIPDFDEGVLADCWFVVGDIWDLVGATEKALFCYRKALDFDPEFAAAHRELANILEKRGQYDDALDHINAAVGLDPEDEAASEDQKRIEKWVLAPEPIPASPPSEADELYEKLSEGQFSNLLSLLADRKDALALQVKSCAFGALHQHDDCIQNLRTHKSLFPDYQPGYIELFYIPA